MAAGVGVGRTEIAVDRRGHDRRVGRDRVAVDHVAELEVVGVVDVAMLEVIGQPKVNRRVLRNLAGAGGHAQEIDPARGRKDVVIRHVLVNRQADLLELVGALRPAGGLARGLNGRQQQAIKTAMIAITTRSSIRVNPVRGRAHS